MSINIWGTIYTGGGIFIYMKYIITEEQYDRLWFLRRNNHIKEVVEDNVTSVLNNFEYEHDYFIAEVIFRSARILAQDYKLPYQVRIQLEDYIQDRFGNTISNSWIKKFRPTQF
jgi:hypothetical protein